MAVGPTKKVQTMINQMAREIEICRAAHARMVIVRDFYTTVNPDPTGTALEGNVAAVNTAINSLGTEIDTVLWDGMISAKSPSHRSMAMEEDGYIPPERG